MCDDLREDPLFTEHSPPEEIPPYVDDPFVWWPPGFPDEEQNSPPSQKGGETAEATQDETDIRLSRAYRIIDEQALQLRCISRQLDQLRQEQQEEREQQEKNRRRARELRLLFLNAVILSSVLIWRRELSQAGWSIFQWLCELINISQKSVVGFITAIVWIWLLYWLGKWIWRFTLEDLREEAEDDEDEEDYPF